MAFSKVYGLHIQVDSDNNIIVQAHKLVPNLENHMGFSFDEPIGEPLTRNLDDKRSAGIVANLLELPEWQNRGDWRDFECLGITDNLFSGEAVTTKVVKDWYEALPAYEVTL